MARYFPGLLALVGFSAPLPASAAEPEEAAEAASALEILTMNTWGLPNPIAKDRRGRFPLIAKYLEQSGADIAGLQEVWRGALSLLSLEGLAVPDGGIDTGLALVTPHTVKAIGVEAYDAERSVDALKSKGILQARLGVPEVGDVEVFVTHMQAGGGTKNAKVREAQAAQLLERVNAAQGPAVVLGDFNLYAGNETDERTWSTLQAAGLVDAAVAVGDMSPTYLDSQQRFDQVYLRDGGAVRLTAAEAHVVRYDDDPETAAPPRLSDHQPLRVKARVFPIGPAQTATRD
jgi:endonuclease/exonuclease/phosphatase family metal-dependent hydrolase